MTNIEAFNKLKELSTHLQDVQYEQITDLFEIIGKMPIPVAYMAPGTLIDRARPNNGDALFTSVEELGYIKDEDVIKNRMLEFGRANRPHAPVFYGAINSTLIGHPRITALAETSELLQDKEAVNLDGKLYTISRWKTTEELALAEMVFSRDAIATNPDIKKAFEKQTEFMKEVAGEELLQFYTDYIVFISEQFARRKQTHHDYMISAAYADYIMYHTALHGVAFPSVQTAYQGQNIVLPPAVVDEFLVIEVLATQRVFKNKMHNLITNHKNCVNPRDCAADIAWTDLDQKYMTSKEEIEAFLKQ